MTAEPDLPINDAVPAPTKIEPGNLFLWNWRQMQVYAQACVAHATAAKDAEVEALRADVERLTFEMERLQQQYDERTACMIVHRGSALACSDAVRAAYSEEHERAERLAEALREWWAAHRPLGWTEDQHLACPHVNLATDTGKALADALLRDQENNDA